MSISRYLPGHKLGGDWDSSWARRAPARIVRKLMIQFITRPVINLVATPSVIGQDRLANLDHPIIFAVNHSSHIDTSVVLVALPEPLRHRCAVAARSDYFFDKFWKATLWSLWVNVIPLEKEKANRQAITRATEILESGWSLIIFPEGTRGEDDFVLPFRPGAAYLSLHTGYPVVPVHIEGTRRVFTPYSRRLRFGRTRVTFGHPLYPSEGERSREYNIRIEDAVAAGADEGRTDWWSSRRRAHQGTTPTLRAPDDVRGWRRNWASSATWTTPSKPNWP